MRNLFVSYANQDKERVADIVAALENAGWSVWWDDRLSAGARLEQDIPTQLEKAAAILVIWSRHSLSSDWVSDEAEYGKSKDKLVPILIDNVAPPFGFRRLHTAELTHWDGSRGDPRLQGILEDVEKFAGAEAPAQRRRPQALPIFGARYSAALYAVAAVASGLSGVRLLETTLSCPQGEAYSIYSCESALQDQVLFTVSIAVTGLALVLRSALCTWTIAAEMGHQQFYARQARARHLSAQAFGHVFLFMAYFIAIAVDMAIFDEGYGATYKSVILGFIDPAAQETAEGRPYPSTRDFMIDMFALVTFGVLSLFAFIYTKRQKIFGDVLLVAASLMLVGFSVVYFNYGALAWMTDGFDMLRRSYAFLMGVMFASTGVLALISVTLARTIKARA